MKRHNDLLDGRIGKLFAKYVLTSATGMLMVSMYILFDTIFVGQRFGEVGLAALNISIPIYNLLFGIGILIGAGSATLISVNLGRNDKDSANRVFEHAIILGAIAGAAFTILGLFFLDNIIVLLGASGNNIDYVKEYLTIVFAFSWSFIMTYNLSPIVRSDGAPRRVMIAMGLGGLTNIVFDYIFIFPLNMGMKGAAAATVLSSLVSLGILSWHFIGKHSEFKLKRFNIKLTNTVKIFKIGFSGFIVEVSSGLLIFLFNKELLKILGDIGVSAYSIIANIALMVTSILTGVSQGIQPIISINYGANKVDRTYRIRRLGFITAISIGIFFLAIGLLHPEFLISVFTSAKGEIVNITKFGIRIYFFAFPIIGVNVILAGYYQAIEQARLATTLSLLRGPVLTFIFVKLLTFALGSTGIWLTTPITELSTLFVLIIVTVVEKQFENKEIWANL